MYLTREHLGRAGSEAATLRTRLERMKEKSEEMMETAVAAVETTGGAMALGVLHGYRGAMPAAMGIELDLGLFLGLHLLGFSGYATGYEKHLHNLANGAGAYYLGLKGVEIGQRLKEKKESGGSGGQAWDGYSHEPRAMSQGSVDPLAAMGLKADQSTVQR